MRTKTGSERARLEAGRWRREQLVDSGFPLPLAVGVANDARYDLHALIELVECGCGPDLAVRILAPLGEETPA